jgi:hypothetical protein
MTPILFAAALAASTPGAQKDLTAPLAGKSLRTFVLPPGAPLPPGAVLTGSPQQLYAGAFCQKKAVLTSGPKFLTPEAFKELGELPPGLLEHAVNRLVNGCPVREIVFGGQTYYLDMPVATLERADPAARTTQR